jgi:rhodanese-related sulfurtransferase
MKNGLKVLLGITVLMVSAVPALAAEEWVARFSEVLAKAPAEGDWQVKTDDLAAWIKEGRKDFLVVDVRPAPPVGPGQQGGKIPGALYIPYNEILKAENLAKLPKDRKLVLACVTGQTQNLPVLALRILGYDALTLKFGFAGWLPGYFGGQFMSNALQNAATKNYPVVQ